MMIPEYCILDLLRFMASPRSINPVTHSDRLYHSTVHLYQHSKSSCRLFSNPLRSLDYALLIPRISLISLDRTAIQNTDNSYLEFNSQFFRQNIGGPMGSPLTIALAEIRVSYIEDMTLRSFLDPPPHYYHFVDDGFGHFRNRSHAESFLAHLNSLSPDLEYTIKHPSADGSIPFLDVLIHHDNSTSVYCKPTNTNVYTHFSSSVTIASKESTVRTLTRRAFCSPHHLQSEINHLESTFLSNGYPLRKLRHIMDRTLKRLKNTTQQHSVKQSNDNLVVSIPYDSRYSSSLRKSLSRYHIGTVFKSTNTLRSILTHTKTPTAAKHQSNVIYKIP